MDQFHEQYGIYFAQIYSFREQPCTERHNGMLVIIFQRVTPLRSTKYRNGLREAIYQLADELAER